MNGVWDQELAALDFETTGLSAEGGDRVIEVAVVRGRMGEVPRTWSTLVAPGRRVGATHIHGITEAMVAGQPSFAAIAPTLLAMLGGAVMVAHNAPFDLSFLRMECRRAGMVAPEDPVIDTLGLSRRVLPLASHSLASVCEALSISRTRAHRAADDAAATLRIAWHLLDVADPGRTLDVDGARALCRRRTSAEQRIVMDALLVARGHAQPIEIEYRNAGTPDGLLTRRAITVYKVTTSKVEAFCHLRGEDRIFRLDRIRLV